MLYDHETRRQLSHDHRARLADDARRTRNSAPRPQLHLRALLAHLNRKRESPRHEAIERVPATGR